MSDEFAYWNLMATKVGFKPIVADGYGDIELNSEFVADISEREGPEGEGVSKKRHDRENGNGSPASKKSRGNISDPREVAVGSTGVVSVRIPPPASP
ncbi:hypothetical protein A2U01_0064333, partial [Trifolium medium]|nr:hypothetical protein [Trifolium medium]